MSEELLERVVPDDAPKDRLDRAVARLFGISRGRAMEWIAEDRVRVDGRRSPKGAQVGPGARVSVRGLGELDWPPLSLTESRPRD